MITKPLTCRNDRGIALLLVLWVLILLMTIIVSFSYLARTELEAGYQFNKRLKEEMLLEGAINQAILETIYAIRNPDSEDAWQLNGTPLDYGTNEDGITIIIRPEASKVDLNRSSDVILRGILTSLDVDAETSDIIVDSILDWRDRDDLHRLNGAENDYYQSLEKPYSCKNADFDSIYELLLVRGITRELFYGNKDRPGLRDFLTVYSSNGKIDMNTASREVLLALPGMDQTMAEEIIRRREERPFANMAELKDVIGEIYAGVAPYISIGRTSTYEIMARMKKSGYGISATVDVIGQDYRIRYWRKPAGTLKVSKGKNRNEDI